MADRLHIDKRLNDTVIAGLEKTKLLGLNRSSIERSELFLFALSLGIHEGYRTKLDSSLGFILESAFANRDGAMSSLFSLLINELQKSNEEEKINNQDLAFEVAEEYANTGFKKIDFWLSSGEDTESLRWTLLSQLEDKAKEIGEK